MKTYKCWDVECEVESEATEYEARTFGQAAELHARKIDTYDCDPDASHVFEIAVVCGEDRRLVKVHYHRIVEEIFQSKGEGEPLEDCGEPFGDEGGE